MRTFFIIIFVLVVASFGLPSFASAQSSCSYLGQPCSSEGYAGTCANGGDYMYCLFNDAGPGGSIGGSGGSTGSSLGGTNDTISGSSVSLINPLKGADCSSGNGNCLESFLINILKFVVRIGAIIVILMLVYVGFKFVAARGEPGEITKAREMLLWTVVGALILLGAQVIAVAIQTTVQALTTPYGG